MMSSRGDILWRSTRLLTFWVGIKPAAKHIALLLTAFMAGSGRTFFYGKYVSLFFGTSSRASLH